MNSQTIPLYRTGTVHCHSTYCDGKATLRQMAEAAIAAGVKTLGISCHSHTPDDPDFEPLRNLFMSASFRRSLLQPSGSQSHMWQDGDFRWTASLQFEQPVPLPDGNLASGTLLRVDDFFGKITVHADGSAWRCKAEPTAFRDAVSHHICNHLNNLETEN